MIESERIKLRPFCLEDAKRVYELAQDSDVGIHAGWSPHKNIEESQEVIQNILMQENTFAMIEKKSGLLIGSISLQKDPMRGNPLSLMLGYWIGKAYWGQGYTKEAALPLMKFGFEQLGLQLISVYCYTYNERSKKVIEKLGFTFEGTLRKAVIRYDGSLLDEYLYSMTKAEYSENNR